MSFFLLYGGRAALGYVFKATHLLSKVTPKPLIPCINIQIRWFLCHSNSGFIVEFLLNPPLHKMKSRWWKLHTTYVYTHTPTKKIFQVALAWLIFRPYQEKHSELKPRFNHQYQLFYSSLNTYKTTRSPAESGLWIKNKVTKKTVPKRCRSHCSLTSFI